MIEYQLNAYFEYHFNTQNPGTGNDSDADSLPTYRVYEDGEDTSLATGTAAKRDDANTTGYYTVRAQIVAATGYEVGKGYNVRVQTIVGGVTRSMVVGQFRVVPADTAREDQWTDARAGKVDTLDAMSTAVKAVTDKLATMVEDISGSRWTAHALEKAPTGSGVSSTATGCEEYLIGEWWEIPFNVRAPSGGEADADSLPTYQVYEASSDTPVVSGNCSKRNDAGTVGFYVARGQITSVAGYETDKHYFVRLTATVGGVTESAMPKEFKIVAENPGGGAHAVTITVQATGGLPLVGIGVTVKTADQTVMLGRLVTAADGQVVFGLDNGNYKLIINSTPGYTTENPYDLTVSGTTTLTITLASLAVTPPDNPLLCRVYAYMYNVEGGDPVGAAEGTLDVFGIITRPTGDTGVWADGMSAATTAATGLVYLDIPRGMKVIIAATWPEDRHEHVTVLVPNTETYNLGADLQ